MDVFFRTECLSSPLQSGHLYFHFIAMPKLLLVDGSNYLFRAFHALPPLTTSKGEPTGAIKGFNGMLKTVHDVVEPDCEICVFDAKGKNFRHDMFPQYKASRPPMPDELRVQIEPIFELVRLQGWPLLQVEGVEADDVLATLAVQAAQAGWEVVIATGDKDLAQLVNGRIRLINTMTKTVLDREGVYEKYGVYPERIVDYLALMGDKVDNVPGINKCGPKTAAKWIEQYGSLEEIVNRADEVKGKIGEYLREGIPFLDLARKLVTVSTTAPVVFDTKTFAKREPESEALERFFTRWEMSGGARKAPRVKKVEMAPATGDLFAVPEIPQEGQGQVAAVAPSGGSCAFRIARTAEELGELAGELQAARDNCFPVAIWVAADSGNAMHDAAVGIAFALTPLQTVYVPLAHESADNADSTAVAAVLAPWFAGESAKLFFDAKRCQHVLANAGLPVGGIVHDAMLMSYVLEAHLKHNFAKLAARTAATLADDDEAFYGKGASRIAARTSSPEAAAAFGTRTAAVLRTAAAVMWVKLEQDPALMRIYRELELPVMQVLTSMERTGVLIDCDKLARQSAELAERIDAVKAKIEEIAAEPFNPASPKQLAHVLFEKLGLPVRKKTASGTPSTDEEVLSELALDYPLAKLILEFRALTKLKSTYTDKLPQMVDASDGRVHTTFGQATAVTGRLASSEPNLQNIPVRTPEGRRVREAFVAKPGCKLISADYSQIELRIMAHISQDKGLLQAFKDGKDIHRATAAEVFGVAPEAVTPEQRRMAKVINFGLIYGMSAFGLAQNLGIERRMASHYIEEYFARYPGVARYMQQTRTKAHAQGYVETAFGRRLWLPDILSTRAAVRAGAERAAINAPMQGTAADLIKRAMVRLDAWLKSERLDSRVILQVHDELILEVPEAELERVRSALPSIMQSAATLDVPLLAEVGVADNWEEAH